MRTPAHRNLAPSEHGAAWSQPGTSSAERGGITAVVQEDRLAHIGLHGVEITVVIEVEQRDEGALLDRRRHRGRRRERARLDDDRGLGGLAGLFVRTRPD